MTGVRRTIGEGPGRRRHLAVMLAVTVAGVVLTTLGVIGGRASAASAPPVSTRAWEAVIADYFAHGLNAADSCAASVVARTHLSPRYKEGTAIVHAFDVHARDMCGTHGNPLSATRGMSDTEVADTFGAPVPWLSGPRCWFYRAARAGTAIDGTRLCFTDGVVSKVGIAVHG